MDSDRIVIRRAAPLHGEVVVPGAKNSVLKLMAATLLADGEYQLTNVPGHRRRGDHERPAGGDRCRSHRSFDERRVDHDDEPRRDHARSPRTSWSSGSGRRSTCSARCSLAAARSRCRCPAATTSAAGRSTCTSRASRRWARRSSCAHGYVEATADRLRGADITLEFPSVGATENILTAAVHAKGTTVIDNAAREPEIADLCAMLTSMGADIEGAGSSTLVVHGVEPGSLHAADHAVVADRIQAATYLAAVAVVRRRGRARAAHGPITWRCCCAGSPTWASTVTSVGDGLAVWAHERLRSIDVATLPYPGIATDYKPLIVTMLSVADGVGIVTENLYPGPVPLRRGAAATRAPTSAPTATTPSSAASRG